MGSVREERENNPVLSSRLAARQQSRFHQKTNSQPLGVVRLGRGEESTKRIVRGNKEPGNVGQELPTQIEEDEEKVERDDADDRVGLGNSGRLLEVVESGVLGELMFQISDKAPSR